MTLTVQLASAPDRDDLVAEVWCGAEMVAEVRSEGGSLRVAIYPQRLGGPWDLSLRELEATLQEARRRLSDPGISG